MTNPLLYGLLFLKASLFSTGGFGNLPSLHTDLLAIRWADDAEFGESIAIGQISPGPNGLWVVGLGYLTAGYAGAALALLATTVPALLVLGVAAVYTRIEHQRWVAGLMRGTSLAVVSISITVCWTILHQQGLGRSSWPIAVVAAGLAASKRLPLIAILALAGLVGYALR